MLVILLTFSFSFSSVFAGESDDGDAAAISDLQSKLQSAKSQTDQAKAEYDKAKAAENAIKSQVQSLEKTIKNTEAELAVLEQEIAENITSIEAQKLKIAGMESEISDQNSDLNARLRLMYESGDQSLIGVLLGSENFLDFLENLDMIQQIHKYDVLVLTEMNDKLALLEHEKAELDAIETMLETSKQEQEAKKVKLAEDKAALKVAEAQAHEVTTAKYEIYEDTEAASAAIEYELRMRTYSGEYVGGAMSWPCIGLITSEFGPRRAPAGTGSTNHKGIDIAVGTGTAIRAAADGDVIFSGWNSSGYGYFVMIDHGGGVVTCYAHNSSLAVGYGQHVSRGQVISYAGSTGNSTGPHCHFEVRVNGVAQNPRGWL